MGGRIVKVFAPNMVKNGIHMFSWTTHDDQNYRAKLQMLGETVYTTKAGYSLKFSAQEPNAATIEIPDVASFDRDSITDLPRSLVKQFCQASGKMDMINKGVAVAAYYDINTKEPYGTFAYINGAYMGEAVSKKHLSEVMPDGVHWSDAAYERHRQHGSMQPQALAERYVAWRDHADQVAANLGERRGPIQMHEFAMLYSYSNVCPVFAENPFAPQTRNRINKVRVTATEWSRLEMLSDAYVKYLDANEAFGVTLDVHPITGDTLLNGVKIPSDLNADRTTRVHCEAVAPDLRKESFTIDGFDETPFRRWSFRHPVSKSETDFIRRSLTQIEKPLFTTDDARMDHAYNDFFSEHSVMEDTQRLEERTLKGVSNKCLHPIKSGNAKLKETMVCVGLPFDQAADGFCNVFLEGKNVHSEGTRGLTVILPSYCHVSYLDKSRTPQRSDVPASVLSEIFTRNRAAYQANRQMANGTPFSDDYDSDKAHEANDADDDYMDLPF